MARALATTQFLIVSIGAFTLHLLEKINSKPIPADAMGSYAQFLARYALWLFAIPILYAVVGIALEGRVSAKAIRRAGLALCAILVALVGFPICYHLF